MSDDPQAHAPSQAPSQMSSKQPYEAPTLKRLGSIADLTHGGTFDVDDFTLAGSVE
jgi:hypothetical protein